MWLFRALLHRCLFLHRSEMTRLDQVLQRPDGRGQLGYGESVSGHLRYPSDGGSSLGQRVGHDRLVALCWHFSPRNLYRLLLACGRGSNPGAGRVARVVSVEKVTLCDVAVLKGRDLPIWSSQGLTGQEPCGGMGLCAFALRMWDVCSPLSSECWRLLTYECFSLPAFLVGVRARCGTFSFMGSPDPVGSAELGGPSLLSWSSSGVLRNRHHGSEAVRSFQHLLVFPTTGSGASGPSMIPPDPSQGQPFL